MTKKKHEHVYAWHFVRNDMTLRYDLTGRQVAVGRTLKVDPSRIELCAYGFHASTNPLDALSHAPGTMITRVKLSGLIKQDSDKLVASERKVLWIADAERTISEFAIWCAREALDAEKANGRTPDPRSYAALEAKHKYLNREISAADLSAARSASWSAAESAAWSAARSASWSAARSAAWSAAESAAWSAAESAAWSAARSASWSAARSASWSAAESAARSAARSASWSAARKRQAEKLHEMLMSLKPGSQHDDT